MGGGGSYDLISATSINAAIPQMYLYWLTRTTSYANDAAAAAGTPPVNIGQLYRNGSNVMIRVA